MIEAPEIGLAHRLTNGEIAVINLKSARQRAWSLFWGDPLRPGIAESIVEQEQLTAQFVGDICALDRLASLAQNLERTDPGSPRTDLIRAQIASMAHRFAEARRLLEKARSSAELSDAANRLSLSIDQACGTDLQFVLDSRRRMAAQSGRLEDLVPLAALHADLREFDKADAIYQRALKDYRETSPFSVAWVCFQLGAIWGELVAEPQPARAEYWYQKAIEFLPCYVKARVHLSEILLDDGRAEQAEELLAIAIHSGDPEVNWRLADVLSAMGKKAAAEDHLEAARSGFEALLQKHLLAFADHGAEFYSGSGNNVARAFQLANINLNNRPTLRAFEQTHEAALATGDSTLAAQIAATAEKQWGLTSAFARSQFAQCTAETLVKEPVNNDRS